MTGYVIVPTRERPHNIQQYLRAWNETVVTENTHLILAVDNNDPYMTEYEEATTDDDVTLIVGKPDRMVNILNRAFNTLRTIEDGFGPTDWIGFMGDDHRPRTTGWDETLHNLFASWTGVAYGNDLFQRRNLATAAFISAPILTTLGFIAPPCLWHLYVDNFWMELGATTSLVYLEELVFEHLHPAANKADWDDSYKRNNSHETYAHDEQAYNQFLRTEWRALKQTLTEQIA